MLYFQSDYTNGACEEILARLYAENMNSHKGYTTDDICESAREKIKKACKAPQAHVHFAMGGTQANALVLSAVLSSCGGVISAKTGHIAVHEAGAIEHTGHKVLCIDTQQSGKITAQSVEKYMQDFISDDTSAHMVQPECVYISQPTENGAVYTKAELCALRKVCDAHSLTLFADGARLGYALASENNDVTLETMAQLCDVFYIGGTKCGALFGEAIVFTSAKYAKNFFTLIKQRGALLAKGFLLGIQFDTLFTDNLYIELAKNAVKQADFLRSVLKQKAYTLFCENTTNQVFAVMPNEKLKELESKALLQVWQKESSAHTVVRIATSWATKEQDVKALTELL